MRVPRMSETRFPEWAWNGRRLHAGQTEVSIDGERGRFRFLAYVVGAKGTSWVEVRCDRTGHLRAFRPERIRTVHSKPKLRPNSLPEPVPPEA